MPGALQNPTLHLQWASTCSAICERILIICTLVFVLDCLLQPNCTSPAGGDATHGSTSLGFPSRS